MLSIGCDVQWMAADSLCERAVLPSCTGVRDLLRGDPSLSLKTRRWPPLVPA